MKIILSLLCFFVLSACTGETVQESEKPPRDVACDIVGPDAVPGIDCKASGSN